MAYDKTILAAVRREMEHEKANREAAVSARRAAAYVQEPRLAQIDRTLSGTAASVLRAAMTNGRDPEAAIAQLRQQNGVLRAERAGILQRLGLPADGLDDKPACAVCSDSGYLGTKMCECVKRRYAAALTQQLSSVLPIDNQNFSTFRLDVYATQPDARLHQSPRENMEYNLEICRQYANDFEPHAGNLLLQGSTGLGKTFLSTCIAQAVAARGFSVAYETTISATGAYEAEKFGNGDAAAAAACMQRCEHADLLILDDLGTEMITAFTTSVLYNLLNTRLMARRPMIVSTNLTPEQFAQKYSPAIASRLLGEFRMLRFFGDDIRLQKQYL